MSTDQTNDFISSKNGWSEYHPASHSHWRLLYWEGLGKQKYGECWRVAMYIKTHMPEQLQALPSNWYVLTRFDSLPET